MKATALEFRFRVLIISATYFLGFFAPWVRLGRGVSGNPPRLWSWLAIEIARIGLLPVNSAYLMVTAVAIACAVAGGFLRVWGTAYLGQKVMRGSSLQASEVQVSGPYRHLRNPLYLGMLLSSSAISVLMPTGGAVVFLAIMILFTARLIAAEQAFMSAQLGDSYRAYRSRVPLLWPRLRSNLSPSGTRPRWKEAAMAEFFFISTAVCFAALAWQYDADLLTRAVIVCFGLALILQALIGTQASREGAAGGNGSATGN